MSVVMSHWALEEMLNALFTNGASTESGLVYKLFVDSLDIHDTDLSSSGWELATGGGYADITDTTLVITVAVGADSVLTATLPTVTFTFTGALTNSVNKNIKKVGVFSGRSGRLIASEILASPFSPGSGGGTFGYTLKVKFGAGTPTS